jgi:hypothetical protein
MELAVLNHLGQDLARHVGQRDHLLCASVCSSSGKTRDKDVRQLGRRVAYVVCTCITLVLVAT